jgi:hypothetical protein
MLDEKLLTRSLERAANDASSRALDEIMHLAQSAKYEPAAVLAAELLDAGCKDVRAFLVYALGVFAERGPASVPALFEPISAVLSGKVAESAPSPSVLRTTDTALRFGFRILRAHLDFDDRRPEVARQAWSQHVKSTTGASVQRACAELRKAIHALIEAPACDAELGAVIARLEAYCARTSPDKPPVLPIASPPPAVSEEPVTPLVEPEPVDVTPEPPLPALSEAAPGFARRASDFEVDPRSFSVSPALAQFVRKLEVFEYLVANASLAKAAIVAHDIRNVIANFDPMIYLPNLLAPHFRLLSGNADELAVHSAESSSPSWQALEQLYRVDLDAFVEA